MKRLSAILMLPLLLACAQTPETAAPLTGDPAPNLPFSQHAPPGDAAIVERFSPGCPPDGWDRAKLEALKADGFEIVDVQERQDLAKAITACLASGDPLLRDGVAFEGLSRMLREGQLSEATMRALLEDLTARLKLEVEDPLGFGQSFAALALSEVARADRIAPFMVEDELVTLLADAQHWFINISDYRGFSDAEGWRHAVAHGSDLLMQLALNPRIDAEGLRLIVSATGAQVAPESHAYVHGEPERLARPILFAAQRGVMSEAEWTQWITALATPLDADTIFTTEAGLAWRHNTMALLLSLHANVVLSADPQFAVLRPGVEAALKEMP